jgi:hypothetical protein
MKKSKAQQMLFSMITYAAGMMIETGEFGQSGSSLSNRASYGAIPAPFGQ